MGKLTTEARNALPDSVFAGPGRSYPVNNPSHAANAKARASQAVNAGRMSTAQEAKIDAKADAVLGKKQAPKKNRSHKVLQRGYHKMGSM